MRIRKSAMKKNDTKLDLQMCVLERPIDEVRKQILSDLYLFAKKKEEMNLPFTKDDIEKYAKEIYGISLYHYKQELWLRLVGDKQCRE